MSADATSTRARLWSLTRADGLALGFTDHDRPLAVAGLTHRPQSGMSARAVAQGAGLAVDNSEAAGVLSHDAITEADLIAGRWDGAEVRLWECDWTAPEASRVLVFRGSLGEIARDGGAFRAELRGLAEALNRPLGRVYHPRCAAVLGDSQCKVNLAAPGYTAEGAVLSVTEARVFRLGGLQGYDTRWFERGRLAALTSPAAGLEGMVKIDRPLADGSRLVELWSGLMAPIDVGDRVRLTAGCDKTTATCRLKFANFLNYRGFPQMPSEDWLIAPQAAGNRAPAGG